VTTCKVSIKGYRLKAGKLVPCLKHLPVNIQLKSTPAAPR